MCSTDMYFRLEAPRFALEAIHDPQPRSNEQLASSEPCGDTTGSCSPPRAAEDELMAVAGDRDRLAPAAEEARWRARQLERQLDESRAAAEAAQAVNPAVPMLQRY